MSAGVPLNTYSRQQAKKKVKYIPHGPGGQMLRPAAKTRTQPRSPQARARGVRVVQRAAAPPKYVPHGPGGQRLRPAPKVRVKPRSPQAQARGRQVVRHSAQQVRKKEAQQKARRYITENPITGLQRSEANAISALATLHASNPKKYDENLKKYVPDVVSKALHKSDPLEVGLKGIIKGTADAARGLHSSQNNLAAISLPQTVAVKNSKTSKQIGKAIENASREATNIPASIVPTAVHIAKPAYQHPGDPNAYVKSAKRLGDAAISLPKAYIKAYEKHGLKGLEDTFVHYPLSTALTLAPIPRVPGLLAGRVATRLGKMPRAAARELPGTAMKVVKPTSRSYFAARRARKKPIKQVTNKDIQHRVDAEVALQEDLARRAQAETVKKTYKARKKVVGKKVARQEASQLATKAQNATRLEHQRNSLERMALLEKPRGVARGGDVHITQPSSGEAQVFTDPGKAQRAADQYNAKHPVQMVPKKVKGGYLVVPKSALDRFKAHEANTETGPISAAFKAYNNLWRKNVLGTHTTWPTGNIGEAGLRSAVEKVGPMSYVRGYKSLAELKRIDPKAYEEMTGHATKGGHMAMQVHVPDETKMNITGYGRLADFARHVQKMRDKPGIRHVANAWDRYTHIVMGELSGKTESFFQTGMLGKELSRSPLMDGHIFKTSRAAIQDAAKGMRETHNQIALGEAIDRMYGQYGKFSPFERKLISHYTPFIAWTLNSLKWLYYYLPKDHPVLTATAASVQPYVEHWLKDKGLSAFVKGALPSFLQGSVPTAHGGHARFPTRYTPFAMAAGEPEDLASALLPQLSGAQSALQHQINWKGQKLRNPDGSPLDPHQLEIYAALTILEGGVPALQQTIGPATNYEKGARLNKKLVKPRPGKDILRSENPFAIVPKKKAKKKSSPFDGSSTKSKSPFDTPTKKEKSPFD